MHFSMSERELTVKVSLIFFFNETKKPHGFKCREAYPTFKVNSTVTQVRLNRYQINSG